MIETTIDLYKSFLSNITKHRTAIVGPDEFNILINEAQLEWLSGNSKLTDFNQKQIDDLDKIKVITDGSFTYNSTILYPIAPISGNHHRFIIPKTIITGIRNRLDNGTISTQLYPRCFRLLNLSFKLNYINNECDLTGISKWMKAWVLRANQLNMIQSNPFRKPSDSRLYYDLKDGNINLYTNEESDSEGYALKFEYLRYPVEIFFNENNPIDTGNPLTGSVNCEFYPEQRKEIVDTAVRIYLERVKDPRYQSYINEEVIKSKNK